MKELFNKYFKISIFSSIVFLIMGILLFIKTEGIIKSFSIIIGLFLLLFGIQKIMIYLKDKELFDNELTPGIFLTIIGFLLIVNTNIIATIIPLVIGICMVVIGAQKLQLYVAFKDSNLKGSLLMLAFAILTLLCGTVFILNPIKGSFLVTKTLGLIIIIYSSLDIIYSLIFKKNIKIITNIIK